MPDRVLNFIKDHFLMDSPVRSQPLLLQSRLRYQQIGVHRAQGLHGTYDVLFLGTGGCSRGLPVGRVPERGVPPAPLSTAPLFADDGRLHKAVRVDHRVHIIEEIRLFPAGQPVLRLLLDPDQAGAGHGGTGAGAGSAVGSACVGQVLLVGWGPGEEGGGAGADPAARRRGQGRLLTPLCPLPQGLVYAATYTAVAQVPFANCSLYRSCGECVLARDPFCAWSRGACRRATLHPPAHPQ